jgi:chromosome segregation ATPase
MAQCVEQRSEVGDPQCAASSKTATIRRTTPSAGLGSTPCAAVSVRYNERMENETEIEKLARMVQTGFAEMHERFEKIDTRFENIDSRFKDVDKRLDLLDQKIDRVDAKLDTHRQETNDGFDAVHRALGGLSATLVDHEERIKALEN